MSFTELLVEHMDINLCPPDKLVVKQMGINLCFPDKLVVDQTDINLCPAELSVEQMHIN